MVPMLIERFNWIASQPAAAAKFMYENNIMYGYKPEEGMIETSMLTELQKGFEFYSCLHDQLGDASVWNANK